MDDLLLDSFSKFYKPTLSPWKEREKNEENKVKHKMDMVI